MIKEGFYHVIGGEKKGQVSFFSGCDCKECESFKEDGKIVLRFAGDRLAIPFGDVMYIPERSIDEAMLSFSGGTSLSELPEWAELIVRSIFINAVNSGGLVFVVESVKTKPDKKEVN